MKCSDESVTGRCTYGAPSVAAWAAVAVAVTSPKLRMYCITFTFH